MIEEIVLKYLNDNLDVEVSTEKNDKLDTYVFIEKTAGGKDNFISRATIAIQSYASSKYKAAKLNVKVKNAMDNIIIMDQISKSKLNNDYEFTDTAKKQYRYQAIYDLAYYE